MKPVDRTTLARVLSAAAAGIALVLATAVRAVGWHEFPAPFYWLDVALVYFLAALPLAATLVSAILPNARAAQANLAVIVLLEVLALVSIPNFYVHARTRHDINRTIGYVQQFRYGEAKKLVHRTLSLAPRARWNGKPLSDAATTIDQVVARLENYTASALPSNATDVDRVRRADALAALGRTREAIGVLDASPTLANDVEACNLRGTIDQTRGEWRTAIDWYNRGKAGCQSLPEPSDRAAGLARAITGVAFCQRKLGRMREAEATWQELLSLADTPEAQADAHFLVAQFYEDAQQAEKAQFHVQQAMKLNPQQYVEPGRLLLGKLVTSHFGCVGIISSPTTVSR